MQRRKEGRKGCGGRGIKGKEGVEDATKGGGDGEGVEGQSREGGLERQSISVGYRCNYHVLEIITCY